MCMHACVDATDCRTTTTNLPAGFPAGTLQHPSRQASVCAIGWECVATVLGVLLGLLVTLSMHANSVNACKGVNKLWLPVTVCLTDCLTD